MTFPGKFTRTLAVAALAMAVAFPVLAGKGFMASDDAKEKDEPTKFLSGYDKLQEGSEADWVWFADGFSPSKYKSVSIPEFGKTGKNDSRMAADYGAEYLQQWIEESKLGWKVVKGGGDLVLEGNIFNAWEPSGAARYWGGWAANPGCGTEIQAKDKSGKVVFEIRHKSKGSTIRDAVENGLEDMVKEIEVHGKK